MKNKVRFSTRRVLAFTAFAAIGLNAMIAFMPLPWVTQQQGSYAGDTITMETEDLISAILPGDNYSKHTDKDRFFGTIVGLNYDGFVAIQIEGIGKIGVELESPSWKSSLPTTTKTQFDSIFSGEDCIVVLTDDISDKTTRGMIYLYKRSEWLRPSLLD